MEVWLAVATVILVSVLVVDIARAYRALPAMLNRLRGRARVSRRHRGE